MLLLQLHSKQTIIIVCASESRSRRRQCFPILKWMKKKPNPLQQLLTLEWQLNVLKPFFSLRFFALFFACFLFDLVWFSFCCLLSSSSVFLAFLFLQAFTLSCSLFVLLFLMHVRPSQKGEQKKNQIQFEAHFFFNAHHKKMKTSWELFLVF